MAEKMFRFDSVSSTWVEVVNVTRFDVPPPIIDGDDLIIKVEENCYTYVPLEYFLED